MKQIIATVVFGVSAFSADAGDWSSPSPVKNADVAIIEKHCGLEFNPNFGEGADKALLAALRRLDPGGQRNNPSDVTPAYVWKISAGEETSYLILERDWIDTIPGTTHVRLLQIGSKRQIQSRAEFNTGGRVWIGRSEEHTSELQSHSDLVCRLLLEKKKKKEE